MSEGIVEHERGSICPICGAALSRGYLPRTVGDTYEIACDVCGLYRVSSTFESILASPRRADLAPLFPYMRAHIRQASDRHEVVTLTTANYESYAAAHMSTPVDSKIRKVLDLVAAAGRPGDWCEVDLSTASLRVDARDDTETKFLLDDLVSRKLLDHQTLSKGQSDAYGEGSRIDEYRLTIDGWQTVSPLGQEGRLGVVFIAMWFDHSLDGAFEAIRASVEDDCGLQAYRVDRVPHNDQITDRILAGIRSSQFLIADVTGQRQGVYFEAGFAMGLGRPVIWCCREDEKDHVHFDTRQFNHVLWNDPTDLRPKLTDRIRGTILTRMKLA